jgi:hypothetical protein
MNKKERKSKLNQNYSQYEKSKNQLTGTRKEIDVKGRELWVNMDRERTRINNLK